MQDIKKRQFDFVSIVIPVFNESEGIVKLLEEVESYYYERKFDFEILFVNDGSTDDTAQIICSHNSFPYKCRMVNFTKNFGSHAAVRAGFLHSSGDYITSLPADLQISFDSIEKLYISASNGFDIVFGVREFNESGYFEKTFSRIYALVMRKYVCRDFPFNGLETLMLNKKTSKVFNNNIENNSSIFLQALSLGFSKCFVAINKSKRKSGKSKWTTSKKIKLLIDSFVAFSYVPIRFVSFIGIILFLVGVFWTVYIVFRKMIYNDVAEGWSMLSSILFLGFGVTNISLGVISEYLWRTFDASRNRPVFILDEIVELSK
jgi:glycosyltransferase involved in cell wall biosynthesis